MALKIAVVSESVSSARGGAETSTSQFVQHLLDQGVDVEEFKADVLAAVAADLNEKVADGSITQEQADRILAKITESIDRIVEKVPGEGAPEGSDVGAHSFGVPRHGGPGFRVPLGDTDGAGATDANFLN